eukprot:jgi/Tetstr1/422340/TSEL_013183.t1
MVALRCAVATAMCSVLCLATVVAGGTCNGMGRRWCTTAHRARGPCPKPCLLERCSDNKNSKPARGGGWKDVRKPTWEELALAGAYEFVYTDSDWLCLGTCWYRPENARCRRWDYWAGNRYCKSLSCGHDDRDRYSGCHADEDGRRKLPWHRPTCKACLHVFATACKAELSEWVADEEAREAEEARVRAARKLETAAREVCYDRHFEMFHTRAEEDQESSSGGKRRSSEDSSEALALKEEAEEMLDSGAWTCPPAQCLTTSVQLLQAFNAPSPPPPQPPPPPPPPAAPWYHTNTLDGYCNWNGCNGRQEGDMYCRQGAEQCVMGCGGTWCPPDAERADWQPVNSSTYTDPAPWYHSNPPGGYCNWNGCSGLQEGEMYCRINPEQCVLHCGGTWCPPTIRQDVWAPVDSSTYIADPAPARRTKAESRDEAEPAPWVPPTQFNTSMCGDTVSGITAEEAEGLQWDMTRAPFHPEASAQMGAVNSAPIERAELLYTNLIEDDADYDDDVLDWSPLLAQQGDPGSETVVFLSVQLAELRGDVDQAQLLAAAAELTGVAPRNLLILEDPAAVTLEEDNLSTVIIVAATPDTAALVAKLEGTSQEEVGEVLSRTGGVTYMPSSMGASTQQVPAALVSNLDHFQHAGALDAPVYVGITAAAAALAAAASLGLLLWFAIRHWRHPLATPASPDVPWGEKRPFDKMAPGASDSAAVPVDVEDVKLES